MRVLVTGGAGYIGSHTVQALERGGHQPVVLDDLSNGHAYAAGNSPLIVGDIGDAVLVRKILREHEIAAVLHFAAKAYVGESVRDPRKYFTNNVSSTIALLGAMLDENVKTIVFSSSCATYGIPIGVPIAEDQPQNPVNPYGWSKLIVEKALESYGTAYGLRWLALRYFNAAGADPAGALGEDHDPETHLVPILIQAALGLRPDVQLFGTDYPTPDGTAVRDYVHVSDLAAAHVLGLEYLAAGGESQALNLGTGRGYSVRQLIEAVQKVSERIVPVREAPRREGDPPELIADPARAARVLGWRPQHSSINEIVGTAWRWHSSVRRTIA
jgi:UDP-glucose-4-epimerase GalE